MTALGAAYLAGLQVGLFASLDDLAGRWQRDKVCQPELGEDDRQNLLHAWQRAVTATRSFANT